MGASERTNTWRPFLVLGPDPGQAIDPGSEAQIKLTWTANLDLDIEACTIGMCPVTHKPISVNLW